ncbi:MAG: cytochrome c oxidase assembly protein [Gammaproteobacteria bacterium]|nr:cytochrome c oxidase assembly protein [Gammaproteobacteria bacterium]NKB65318.1 cytochrome c oxidase assembly protein [Gammaproteobacteria bacterium]
MSGKVKVPYLFLIPVLMFGFGYLMVPMYDLICDITGLNGKTGSISTAEASQLTVDADRMVKVEFLGTVNDEAPWDFGPKVTSMMVHPGRQYQTSFVAKNTIDKTIVGQAIPSVAPGKAATYFNKTECFCFNQQTFEPLESREMPLVFVIDPGLPESIDTVSLSYTFFDTGKLTGK